MADQTPAFMPPVNTVPKDGKDPMIVKIDETQSEWAARKSQQVDMSNEMSVKHIQNGR